MMMSVSELFRPIVEEGKKSTFEKNMLKVK